MLQNSSLCVSEWWRHSEIFGFEKASSEVIGTEDTYRLLDRSRYKRDLSSNGGSLDCSPQLVVCGVYDAGIF
jgi:hypothetical protein